MHQRLLGDVAGGSENAAHGAVRVAENGGIERHQPFLLLAGGKRQLVVGDGPGVERQPHAFGGVLVILEIMREGRADQFLARITRHAAHGVVDVGDVEHRIDRDQAVQRRFDQAAVVGPFVAQLALQARLLGDVAGGGENAAHHAGRVAKHRGVERDVDAPGMRGVHPQHVIGDDAVVKGFLHAKGGALRVEEVIGERGADQVFARSCHHLAHAGVDVADDAIGRHRDQAVDRRFDQAAVVRLRIAQRAFERLLLGDVARGGEHALQPALAVVERRGVVRHHRLAPVFRLGGQFIVGDLAFAQHQFDAFFGARRLGKVVLERLADQKFAAMPGQIFHLLVDVADDADRVGRHQGVDIRLDQRAGIELGRLELFGEADLVGNVFRDRQVADRRAKRVAARRGHHAGRKFGAVSAAPLQGAFPLARGQRRS